LKTLQLRKKWSP
jgi:outer membrane protein OmpA-like peptidoglycan-associated protein